MYPSLYRVREAFLKNLRLRDSGRVPFRPEGVAITWDYEKSVSNIAKHGIRFAEAVPVLKDPPEHHRC